NQILGRAGNFMKHFQNLPLEDFRQTIGCVAQKIEAAIGVPVLLCNIGQARAFTERKGRLQGRTLFLGMGDGLSASLVDGKGRIADVLGELGNVVMDMNVKAPRHTYTRVKGVLQQYLSRYGLI